MCANPRACLRWLCNTALLLSRAPLCSCVATLGATPGGRAGGAPALASEDWISERACVPASAGRPAASPSSPLCAPLPQGSRVGLPQPRRGAARPARTTSPGGPRGARTQGAGRADAGGGAWARGGAWRARGGARGAQTRLRHRGRRSLLPVLQVLRAARLRRAPRPRPSASAPAAGPRDARAGDEREEPP